MVTDLRKTRNRENVLETRWSVKEISNPWKPSWWVLTGSEVQLSLMAHWLCESWALATNIPDIADRAIFQDMLMIEKSCLRK